MNIDIRTSITNNFKDTNDLEIKKAIENTLNDNTVTVRDRDTMEQITISVDELEAYIREKTQF